MPANYVLLRNTTLGASAASVTLSGIPSTGYTDLKLVVSARTDGGSTRAQIYLQFNTDTGSNYSYRRALGYDSASTLSDAFTGTPSSAAFIAVPGVSATASIFGNTEIYIPNYLGNKQKSYSVDIVSENDSTTAWLLGLAAGLWTGTDAINQIIITSAAGSFLANSTFSLYGIAAAGVTPTITPFATGGNIITNDGTYWYHAFLSSGLFTPAKSLTADVLVVAGGGGSGTNFAAGGGAGGLRLLTSQTIASGYSYSCAIGAGGAGGATSNQGITSSLIGEALSIRASGGGRGSFGGNGGGGGATGGSGGGGVSGGAGFAGNVGGFSPVEGFAGGASGGAPNGGQGGGGGAGGVGGNGTNTTTPATGGNGGVGAGGTSYTNYAILNAMGSATSTGQLVSGNYYYAGGGGGGGYGSSGGTAGYGGGGVGGSSSSSAITANQTAGTANTGGGAGGAPAFDVLGGVAGGSGIVIIRYPVA
jgi:hypothetical protein